MYNLTSLPIEIQEIILLQLSGQNLISASKVCKLWLTLCERIAKEKYSKIIPEECILEVEQSGINEDVIWLNALNNHYLSKCVANNIFDQTKTVAVELNNNHQLCYCIFGDLIFIGNDSGEIEVYNPEESIYLAVKLKLEEDPICQLEVMKTKNLLVAKTGSLYKSHLSFFSLPYFSGKSWIYKMTHLRSSVQNFNGNILCERNFSVYGTLLATAITSSAITVFQVSKISKEEIELKCFRNFIADEAVGHISLWKDEVVVLFKTGEILLWDLVNQTTFLTDRYHEIHYENPVWIFRGRIFCSTLISSQLLGYWHMDRGAEYWLMGKPSCELVRCRDLGTMFSADTGVEDVLCICLKQRLLACGTRNGKILLYYLSDTFFFSNNLNNINANESITREFNRVPDLTLRMTERPVRNIQIQFFEDSIKIYTWPYILSGRPELKGLLQCITLKEGDWVLQCDKDFIDD